MNGTESRKKLQARIVRLENALDLALIGLDEIRAGNERPQAIAKEYADRARITRLSR